MTTEPDPPEAHRVIGGPDGATVRPYSVGPVTDPPPGHTLATTAADPGPSAARRAARWLFRAAIPPIVVLTCAVLVPVFLALAAHTRHPHLPFTLLLLDVVGAVWVPTMITSVVASGSIALLGLWGRWQLRRVEIAQRRSWRASSFMLAILAARYRHYASDGTPNALDAALHDVGAWAQDNPPQADAWELAGVEWLAAHPDVFPVDPQVLRDIKGRLAVMDGTS